MFKTDLGRAIVAIVDGILDNVEVPVDQALYVRLRTSVKKRGSRARGKTGFLHFAFMRSWGGRYTSVWFQASDWKEFLPDDTKWKNTSNHDSCWRTDGVDSPIAKIYFEHCRKVAPKIAPIDLESTSDIDRIDIVGVEVEREPDGYHRRLVKMAR